jgi:hypothetical protein
VTPRSPTITIASSPPYGAASHLQQLLRTVPGACDSSGHGTASHYKNPYDSGSTSQVLRGVSEHPQRINLTNHHHCFEPPMVRPPTCDNSCAQYPMLAIQVATAPLYMTATHTTRARPLRCCWASVIFLNGSISPTITIASSPPWCACLLACFALSAMSAAIGRVLAISARCGSRRGNGV